MRMKKSIRTLRVGTCFYLFSTKVTRVSETDESVFSIRLFVDAYSRFALLVHFRTLDDYYVGNPLNHGVLLYNEQTKEEETVNLNRPKFIRYALDYGIRKGWRPQEAQVVLDGIALLHELGYKTEKLQK